MTIASEITRLQGAKSSIKTSIENKGVSVPSDATIDTYSGYIDLIPTNVDTSGIRRAGTTYTFISGTSERGPVSPLEIWQGFSRDNTRWRCIYLWHTNNNRDDYYMLATYKEAGVNLQTSQTQVYHIYYTYEGQFKNFPGYRVAYDGDKNIKFCFCGRYNHEEGYYAYPRYVIFTGSTSDMLVTTTDVGDADWTLPQYSGIADSDLINGLATDYINTISYSGSPGNYNIYMLMK